MAISFNYYLEEKKTLFLNAMITSMKEIDIPNTLKESMIYSLEAGGKRLRPILMIASNESYSEDTKKIQSTAIALEMIHTYSLIHDDLPAMDDDDYRRGKLTNHKKFDEATAILAGDALLTYAFEVILSDVNLSNDEKVYVTKRLSQASGPKGMVAGQILDMEAEVEPVDIDKLERIHALKTGELLSFAIEIGAYLGGANEIQINYLQEFAYYLGLIFQVQDDLLDEFGDPDKLGKPVGSDLGNEKSTYPKLLGKHGAIKIKEDYIKLAEAALQKANPKTSKLMELTNHISKRDH